MPLPETRELYTLLLGGRYARNRMNHTGESSIMVYEGKQVPVKCFPARAGREIKPLLKKDSRDKFRYTLNLNTVRRLDGRTWFKRFFKQQLKHKEEK